jgi:O-antigen ligase/tetratricopeptide (TPR) repeat protein
MKSKLQADKRIADEQAAAGVAAVFWVSMAIISMVPLVFCTAVHRIFALPRFAVLLCGSAVLVALFPLCWRSRLPVAAMHTLARSKMFILLSAYLAFITLSTLCGTEPVASFIGSYENQMGLVTHACFFVCFTGLLLGTGGSSARFETVVWAIVLTGLIVSCYGVAQFFGFDPFVDSRVYTQEAEAGPVVRVISTMGHADYLGNFLLYTTLLSLGLGLGCRGRRRRVALAGFAVSAVAIAATGTRGAWLGLAVGGMLFGVLELRSGVLIISRLSGKRLLLASALLVLCGTALVFTVMSSSASSSIAHRIRSFAAEGMTGSGRTVLWRDALRMVTAYPAVGCGPEGFRRAFLAFKSTALARYSPETNNESSHNSYIDAAVSYGLPGAVLYAALIGMMIGLLFYARKRVPGLPGDRLLLSGLISSIAAVATHNFFIFDQISTGLYFFAFAAISQIAYRLIVEEARSPLEGLHLAPHTRRTSGPDQARQQVERDGQTLPRPYAKSIRLAETIAGAAAIAAALWYTSGLLKSDVEIKQALEAAKAGDVDGLTRHGEAAATTPDPTGAASLLYSTAIVSYLDSHSISPAGSAGERSPAKTRSRLIDAATRQAKQSLLHSLTPDSSYIVLAYLSLLRGDAESVHEYASRAVQWDHNFTNSHWLLGEAFLAEGDYDAAEQEAITAIDLNGSSVQARFLLSRARGRGHAEEPPVDETLRAARAYIATGKFDRARRLISRAMARSRDECTACHRELAGLYEAQGFNESAVAEWRSVARLSSEPAAQRDALRHIEALTNLESARGGNGTPSTDPPTGRASPTPHQKR